MQKTVIYFAPGNQRSTIIANAMAEGARNLGLSFDLHPSTYYQRRPQHDVAIFYSLAGGLRRTFDDYRQRAKVVFADLGYFGRRKRTRFDGYHKLVLNARHPTDYFQNRQHPSHRFESFGIPIRPWRKHGRHIVVVGMSAKAAAHENLAPQQWERQTIAALRQLTDRPIIYRPKPNWDGASPISGSTFGRGVDLNAHLAKCHAVVTHHSNVAVDALLAGIPCICPGGVASVLSGHDLTQIEAPPMPDGREQWAADLAFTQYSVEEMQNGTAFRYLMDEGLI